MAKIPGVAQRDPGGDGAVAQLVAHLHGMQGVRGSNPLSSTVWFSSGRPWVRGAVGSGCSSSGRWHAGGQGFESPQLHRVVLFGAPLGSGAQLVAAARLLGDGMQGVRGSNPLSSTVWFSCGAWVGAQLVAAARLLGDGMQGVRGSNPLSSTVWFSSGRPWVRAQLVAAARLLGDGMQGVRGSNPLSSTVWFSSGRPWVRGAVGSGCSSSGRWHAGGQGFESPQLHPSIRFETPWVRAQLPRAEAVLQHAVSQAAIADGEHLPSRACRARSARCRHPRG